MVGGFYKARFTKSNGETTLGLITLADGKLFGGNSDFMLLGSYRQTGYDLSAEAQISPLSFDKASGIFKESGTLNINGRGYQTIMCDCHSPQSPDKRMQVVLERVP
jgi:hypothetical protein